MKQSVLPKRLITSFLFLFFLKSFLILTVEGRCECMNKILPLLRQDDYRVIMSPEFPRPYCSNLDCIWQIVAPENTSKIHFFSKNIHLRPDRDFIHFYASNSGMKTDLSDPLHSCTGSGYCQFKLDGQFLIIQFKTDTGEPDHYGFQGTVALYDREFHSWISSAFGFFVIGLVSVIVTVAILGIIYFVFLRNKPTTKPDRKLLSKEGDEQKPMCEYLKP